MCLHHLLYRGPSLKVTQCSDTGSPQPLLVAWLLRACIGLQARGLHQLEGRRLQLQLLQLCCFIRAVLLQLLCCLDLGRQGHQELGGQVPCLNLEQLLRLCAGMWNVRRGGR